MLSFSLFLIKKSSSFLQEVMKREIARYASEMPKIRDLKWFLLTAIDLDENSGTT